MTEINVEDYFMVKFYRNNKNNTMKQKKTNSRLVDSWSLTGLKHREKFSEAEKPLGRASS